MPRGRPQLPGPPVELELRITPPDQRPIDDWQIDDKILRFIAFQEGGDDKKLHYHCIITTIMSKYMLTQWIYRIARCEGQKGNAVFFSRESDNNKCYGYVAKHGNCVIRHNYNQTTIDEWICRSKEYLASLEAKKKRRQREADDKRLEIRQLVHKGLAEGHIERTPGGIASKLIESYVAYGMTLPPRGSMETTILTLLYPYSPDFVENFYVKNFSW